MGLKTIVINNKEFIIREFNVEKDSVAELTGLLHRAYKRLADMGLNFIATFQDEEYTRNYLKKRLCYILTDNNKIIGTVFYYTKMWSDAPDIFKQDDVVLFGKFAVEPDLQQNGIGSALLDFIENHAVINGMKRIVLDTSEKAGHLISYYEKRGYKYIHHWQWPDVNYRSVVMCKVLS